MEIKFRRDGIYDIRLNPNDISIHLADIGWSGNLFFSLPTDNWKNAKEGAFWDADIVTREELEKLRIELQTVTNEKEKKKPWKIPPYQKGK